MNNRRGIISRSAVIFPLIFALSACDKLNSPKMPSSYVQPATQMEASRTTLNRGMASPFVLQPAWATNDEQVQLLRDLFEGLTAYDEKGNIVPAVAESWQTKDNKVWRFTLRENALWSNGEVVTAADFVQSWQALAQSESPLKRYLAFMNVQNARAVIEKMLPLEKLGFIAENDRTLRIELDKPTPYLPAMLAHVSLFPQYGKHSESLVSNGAYQRQSADERHIVLTSNPYYWQKEKTTFTQVNYQQITPNDSLESFDVVFNSAYSAPNVQAFPQLCTYFYAFNLADPWMQKSAVRKAIVSMVSIKNLVEDLPFAQPSSAFLPKSLQQAQDLPWEAVVAEQLLAQYEINEQHPLKLRILYDDAPLHRSIATRLHRQLSQSDLLRIESQEMTWENLQKARQQGDYQLIRSGWCADFHDPAAFLNLFYSKSPDNQSGYQNAEFDRLFEDAMKTTDEKVRADLYVKLNQIIQQEHLVLPVFQYRKLVYLSSSLRGVSVNPVNVIYSRYLWRKSGNVYP